MPPVADKSRGSVTFITMFLVLQAELMVSFSISMSNYSGLLPDIVVRILALPCFTSDLNAIGIASARLE